MGFGLGPQWSEPVQTESVRAPSEKGRVDWQSPSPAVRQGAEAV